MQVIETWAQWTGLLKHAQFRQQAIHFMQLLAEGMHAAEASLVTLTNKKSKCNLAECGVPAVCMSGCTDVCK